MRQLFLPACVCLVTWSGTTNSDPRFTLDEFTGKQWANKSAFVQAASPGSDAGATDQAPALKPSLAADTPAQDAGGQSLDDIAALIPDGAIEQPVPSGVVVNNGIPAGLPLPPIAKPVIARSTEEICGTLASAAQRNDLPAPFFIRLLFQESRFKPGVISAAGAQGIAQFMPDTAAGVGLDNPFDPLQAIPASARLLRDLFHQFGNLGLAAAAYNAGPKRIADWLASKGKGKLPDETQGYVRTITGRPVETWTDASARHPGEKLPRHAPCQEAAGLLAWNGPDKVPMPAASPLRLAASQPKPAEIKTAKINMKAEAKTELKSDDKAIKSDRPVVSADKGVAKAGKQTVVKVAFDIRPDRARGKPPGRASTKIAAQQLAAHKRRSRIERVAQR